MPKELNASTADNGSDDETTLVNIRTGRNMLAKEVDGTQIEISVDTLEEGNAYLEAFEKLNNSSTLNAKDKALHGSEYASVEVNYVEKFMPIQNCMKDLQKREKRDVGENSKKSRRKNIPSKIDSRCFEVLQETRQLCPSKVFNNSSQSTVSINKAEVLKELPLNELKLQKVVEQCLEDLVKKVTDDLGFKIQFLASTKTTESLKEANQILQQTDLRTYLLQARNYQGLSMGYTKESSDVLLCEFHTDATEIPTADKDNQKFGISEDIINENKLQLKQMETLKIIDTFYSTIDEIGRMNELFKNEVMTMLPELMQIRRSANYVFENLVILEDIPACTAVYHDINGITKLQVNVYDFGAHLLKDMSDLYINMNQLLEDCDSFRIQFINLSEKFSSVPFEMYVDETENGVLDSTLETARMIYKEFFNNDQFEVLHEKLNAEREVLQIIMAEFDRHVNKLSEQLK